MKHICKGRPIRPKAPYFELSLWISRENKQNDRNNVIVLQGEVTDNDVKHKCI